MYVCQFVIRDPLECIASHRITTTTEVQSSHTLTGTAAAAKVEFKASCSEARRRPLWHAAQRFQKNNRLMKNKQEYARCCKSRCMIPDARAGSACFERRRKKKIKKKKKKKRSEVLIFRKRFRQSVCYSAIQVCRLSRKPAASTKQQHSPITETNTPLDTAVTLISHGIATIITIIIISATRQLHQDHLGTHSKGRPAQQTRTRPYDPPQSTTEPAAFPVTRTSVRRLGIVAS